MLKKFNNCLTTDTVRSILNKYQHSMGRRLLHLLSSAMFKVSDGTDQQLT